MKSEILIYDTGRASTWLCLFFTPVGLAALYGAVTSWSESLLASLLCGLLGLSLLSLWILRTRLYLDADRREIVIAWPALFWFPWRVSLKDAVSIYRRDVRMKTSVVSGTDIGIRYSDGRRRYLIRVAPGDHENLGLSLSEAALLPVIYEV